MNPGFAFMSGIRHLQTRLDHGPFCGRYHAFNPSINVTNLARNLKNRCGGYDSTSIQPKPGDPIEEKAGR